LHNDCAFENKEHAKGEKTEVPVFIEQPEGTAENLKHEKGCDKVFFINVEKFWDRNIKLVLTPN
jgi:hypothetical protein